jgi:peptide/nickel transport system substrate-binding protein
LRQFGSRIAAIVCAALVAAACSSGTPSSGTVGTIVYLSEAVPSGFDSEMGSVNLPQSQGAIFAMMDQFMTYAPAAANPDGIILMDQAHYQARLATDWAFNSTNTTLTFHLRHGVKSCAGNEFTADDVVYTYARGKSQTGEVALGEFQAQTQGIDNFQDPNNKVLGDEVAKIDKYTVVFKLASPATVLTLPSMAQAAGSAFFDSKLLKAHATAADPWSHQYANNMTMAAFGPYCAASWVKDSSFTVTANPGWWNGVPPIHQIVFKAVPESSNRVAALKSGDAQLIDHLTPSEINSLKSAPGVKVGGVFGNQDVQLNLNRKVAPFDDPLVRQAIAYGLPYDQIISQGFLGQAKRWVGVIPPNAPFFHAAATQYSYDPAKAAQLLVQAGYPGGKGLEKFGSAFQLTYVAEKETTIGPVVTLMRSSLRALGIPVELNPVPATQYASLNVKSSIPFAYDDQEVPIPSDGGYSLLIAFTTYGCCTNRVNYANPQVDDLVRRANLDQDPTDRAKILNQAQDTIMADLPFVPVVTQQTYWAWSTKIAGIAWNPDNNLIWEDLKPA